MSAFSHSSLYTQYRALLRGAGLTLDVLQVHLAEAGFAYSYHTVASWSRPERGLPRDPRLLLALTRLLVSQHHPQRPCPPERALAFLHAAGLPPAQLDRIADLFPDDTFAAAKQAVLADTSPPAAVPPLPPTPSPLPAGSLPPPFEPNPLFRGRDALMQEVMAGLCAGRTIALIGIGGAGKTQIAGEIAYRYGSQFPGGVFWVNTSDPLNLPEAIAACGGEPGMQLSPHFDQLPLRERLRRVRAAWSLPTPRLVILDNVDTLAALEQARPPLGGCRVLLTSQSTEWPAPLGVTPIAVGPLRREESRSLLTAYHPGLTAEQPQLDQLAGLLGDLPLALHLAGSLLAAEAATDATALMRLITALECDEAQRRVLDTHTGQTPTGHEPSVAATVRLALAQLDPDDPTDRDARMLLAAAAALAPGEPLPSDLLLAVLAPSPDPRAIEPGAPWQAAPPGPRAHRALQRLLARGLVERATEGHVRLHRLIAGDTRSLPEWEAALPRIERVLLAAARSREIALDTLRPLIPHLQARHDGATHHITANAALVAMDIGWYHTLLGNHATARAMQAQALTRMRQVHSPSHPDALESLVRLALAHEYADDFRQAWPLWEEVLALDPALRAPDHSTPGLTLCNAGLFFVLAGDYNRAEALLRESLAIRRATRPLLHQDIGRSVRNLGWLALHRGQYRRAQHLLRLAVAIFTRLWPDERQPALVAAYRLIGAAHLGRGEYAAAETWLQRALDRAAAIFRVDSEPAVEVAHESVAEVLLHLGMIDLARGERARARMRLTQAQQLYERTGSTTSLAIARLLGQLALLDAAEGRAVSARTAAHESLAMLQRLHAGPHLEIAHGQFVLGRVLLADNDCTGAHAALEAGLEATCRILPAHPQAAHIRVALAQLALLDGEPARAAQLYGTALATLMRVAPHHPDAAHCQAQLVRLGE